MRLNRKEIRNEKFLDHYVKGEMKKEKKKRIIVWIVISWLLPIMVTAIMGFGIVLFCLKAGLESEMYTSLAIIYIVWAIIITFRSMLWISKKISEKNIHDKHG